MERKCRYMMCLLPRWRYSEAERAPRCRDRREEADKEKARKLKDKGNEAFRGGRYAEATRLYTESIASWPGEATVYSNRAAALLKQMRFAEAEADCNRALELGRDFNVKTLLR